MNPSNRSGTRPCLAISLRMLVPVFCTVAAVQASGVQAQGCGNLKNHYGPFDYRSERHKLTVVEQYHFTPEVEALLRGKSSQKVAADLSYLMNTAPNHHRGLMAVVRLAEKAKSPQPVGLQYPVECYFDRALRFRQDDTVVRIIYAQFLHKQGREEEALQQLDSATAYAKENALSLYNIGLAYFEMAQYDQALKKARRARSLGLPNKELEEMLKRKGKWQDSEG